MSEAVCFPEGFGPALVNTGSNHLAAALAKAQGAIKNAVKDQKNDYFSSKYADLAAVRDACYKALSENQIAVIQKVSGGPETITITTCLVHSSGQREECSFTIRPAKADAQGLGSAITYGRRYGLAAMVGVAPEGEDDDGNAASRASPPSPPKEKKTIPLYLPDGSVTPCASAAVYLKKLEKLLEESDPVNPWQTSWEANRSGVLKIKSAAEDSKDEKAPVVLQLCDSILKTVENLTQGE